MSAFEKVIGYDRLVEELEQIADILKRPQAYRDAGARVPAGLLLHGDPGVGKTLMAECLIEESGVAAVTCRKDKPNGEFVDAIRNAFGEAGMAAAEGQPAIVYLDDMDKFANEDDSHRNAEEYVTVQACIDEARGTDVFVLATVNEMHRLPNSLVRAGRFDRIIHVGCPTREDSERIMRHYLGGKPLAEDIDPDDAVKLARDMTCAEIEAVVNGALLASVRRREEHIGRDSFVGALVGRDGATVSAAQRCPDPVQRRRVAVHEAGHAAVLELLAPGSCSLVVLLDDDRHRRGETRKVQPLGMDDVSWDEVRLLAAYGGRAATELVYGMPDVGASEDLRMAQNDALREVGAIGTLGFSNLDSVRRLGGMSDEAMRVVHAEMERRCWEAKRLLAQNQPLLDAIADALCERGYLLASDIRALAESAGAHR